MGVLKGHFRPEFLNRIDEIIVFHGLSRDNIRAIVQIQLQRVERTAAAQDITLKMDQSVVDHLAEAGYRPEFGARELKRQIRQELETRLAKEILNDRLKPGDTVEVSYDKESDEVKFSRSEVPPASKVTGGSGRAKKKPSKEVSSAEPTESTAAKQ